MGWWNRTKGAISTGLAHARRRLWPRPVRALQVEVTSRCTRGCRLCPRNALADDWQDGDLSVATWERLEPALEGVDHVHLQGWGEPLLHPRIGALVESARRAGCTVGLTSNGDLLPDQLDWIADGGLERLSVSAAGAGAQQAALRDEANLDAVLAAAAEAGARAAGRGHRIWLQLSYLLTRDNAAELPTAVSRAAHFGLDEVYVIHLDCRPTAPIARQSAFGPMGLAPGVGAWLDRAAATAARKRIGFRAPSRSPQSLLTCSLDPSRMAFVGWDGRVGPCVNLLLPIRGPIPRQPLDPGDPPLAIEPVCAVDLAATKAPLDPHAIARSAFGQVFTRRKAAEVRFLANLDLHSGTRALARLDAAAEAREASLARDPFPPACRGCPKQHGW